MKFIPVSEPDISGNEKKYVVDCIETGWISSLGKYVAEFEEKFSRYCDTKYGVAVNNGTSALHLALAAVGIEPGDEVIIPDMTFIATANVIAYLGGKPVFVDSEPKTWNIDASKIEAKITKKTKAIMPVHLYGHPCYMDTISEIAEKHSLYVVEDAAEAHGAEYKGKKVGGLGHVGCFSFYGNKIITTGEGGMCVTNDEELAEKMRLLKDHGMSASKRYWHNVMGFNFRMTNIQAAIGVAQLEKIDSFVEKKRQNAALYASLLKDVKGLTLQAEEKYAKNVYWMYSILVNSGYGMSREKLIEKLKNAEIDSRPFFYPMHEQPIYATKEKFPVAEEIAAKGLNLPSSVKLSKSDIERIASAIAKR